MSGVLLAIISAAIFGFQNAAARRAVVTATPTQGMILTVPTVLPLLTLICYFSGGFDEIEKWNWLTFFFAGTAGISHFVIGRFCNYVSIQALGSILSTPIQQLSTIMSLVCAIIFLNENLTGLNILGILLVSIGPILLINRRHSYASHETGGEFKPDLKRGIVFGLICVLGYGSSPILIVLSLHTIQSSSDIILSESFTNSLVILFFSYLSASVLVIILGAALGGLSSPKLLSLPGARWFLLSGFMIAVSQIFRYTAFALAPVSVVVPIQRISVIFRLLFNAYFNRQYERIDTSIVFGIILSVVGAIALGVETKVALNWLGVGETIYRVLSWQL